ncbi:MULTISPECIES: GAF and ANTAR domain-containing protein [Aeromicrobium]|uniref:GAF and ANTAR domain-containing protein n=1 Tax=Aeromicrobium TaxID=2040 RepID=UPI0006F7F9CB|nr:MULTISPECIES: GAF and ANTAR domain-containing protein [Aeromicrobium]KQX75717.1 hypothetical protein ASD10_11335 [Aeromicrobium sp. Root472D3]MCL8251137.1 GAF and ANTAR domain-containing protein [Aeromicrobium fastidiosum]
MLDDDVVGRDDAALRGLVATLVAAEARPGDQDVTALVMLERLCRAAMAHLEAEGTAVSLMSVRGSQGVVASADQRSFQLDELQFSLGEGPSREAFAARRPVLVPNLDSPEGRAWPMFSTAASQAGVCGVLSLPLQVGVTTFGVLTIYLAGTDPFPTSLVSTALTFADLATDILLSEEGGEPGRPLHPGLEFVLEYRAEIYQAQGVVSVDLGIGLSEAMARMRAHAFAHQQTVAELAARIMAGEVRLDAADETEGR